MRFSLPENCTLRPYVVTTPPNFAAMTKETAVGQIQFYDAYSEDTSAFAAAINRGNCLAHDNSTTPGDDARALGMPPWVMLDCGLIPAGTFGFEAPAEQLPADARKKLDPSGTLEWIAVSEYVAVPSMRPGDYVGISMYSLVSGLGLGIRTKALALKSLGAKTLAGVTQFNNRSLAVHIQFGPLEIVSTRVAIHARPDESFVYRMPAPADFILDDMIAGKDGPFPVRRIATAERLKVDPRNPRMPGALSRRLDDGRGGWHITEVAPLENGGLTQLLIARIVDEV